MKRMGPVQKDIRSYWKDMRNYGAASCCLFVLVAPVALADSEAADVPVSNPVYREGEIPMDREDVQNWVDHQTPSWGFEVTGSSDALGGQSISPFQASTPARSVSIEAEYQPDIFQSLNIGVLSFGPSFAIYPLASNLADSSTRLKGTNFLSLWSAGGQVRYQAYFSPHQFLIPMAAYSVEMLDYNFSAAAKAEGLAPSGSKGILPVQGPSVGLWLLLNDLSRDAAVDMYENTGFLRSYLVAEYQVLKGSNPAVNVAGSSFYFGIRLER